MIDVHVQISFDKFFFVKAEHMHVKNNFASL